MDEGQPFGWANYRVFAFLAGVRNYSCIAPLSEPRGLPDDLQHDEERDGWLGDHSFFWLSVAELEAFDYDAEMEDRRTDFRLNTPGSGPDTCAPGEGVLQTWRQYLGPAFFADIAELRRIGADRVVFGFDS